MESHAPQTATWDDLCLRYGVAGADGSPVLLVMGYLAPGRAWRHQIPALAAHHRVAWFDNRGCGGSSAPAGVWATADLAADAARLLDHLGWDRAHVVGVSMGGMIAQALAIEHRARLRSLSLIATHAGGWRARVPPLRGALAFLQATAGSSTSRGSDPARAADRMAALERMLFPEEWLQSADRAALRRDLTEEFGVRVPAAWRLAQLAAVLRHDARSRLRELAGLPTLIVKPGRDLLIDPRNSDALHRAIPGARLLELPGAGHGVVRQCPAELNAALLGHFAAADATADPPGPSII